MATKFRIPSETASIRRGCNLGQFVRGALLVLLFVLAAEFFQVIVRPGAAMLGLRFTPWTPMLRVIGGHVAEVKVWTSQMSQSWIHQPRWKAGPTIGLALAWAGCAALLLRGMRR